MCFLSTYVQPIVHTFGPEGVGRLHALDEILEAIEAELLVEPPLLCVVVGNPQLDLVYQHQVEAETSRFGTREIREALGG